MNVTIEDILGLIKENEDSKKETIKIKLERLPNKEFEFKKVDYKEFLEIAGAKNADEVMILNSCINPNLRDQILQKNMFEPTDIVKKVFLFSEQQQILKILLEESGITKENSAVLVEKAVSDIKN
jgi:predicted transcriptional regulator|nr:MAG TPA: tail assembly chaperone protein [Caudoviricetes sp.]